MMLTSYYSDELKQTRSVVHNWPNISVGECWAARMWLSEAADQTSALAFCFTILCVIFIYRMLWLVCNKLSYLFALSSSIMGGWVIHDALGMMT